MATSDVTIWRICGSCWISKAARTHALTRPGTHTRANTHREIGNTNCFSTVTMVSRTRLIVTLYVHCVSCLVPRSSKWSVLIRFPHQDFVRMSLLSFYACYMPSSLARLDCITSDESAKKVESYYSIFFSPCGPPPPSFAYFQISLSSNCSRTPSSCFFTSLTYVKQQATLQFYVF